ncbi:transcriptional regulator, LysR family [Thermosinus carboxydivorans Nor1]|uniref:Transcriptional regulator, LysR family n=1 Tax=Thermosinus carboxydivorans Nor1 TaxID=401526 RepID=A1HMF8_9FIRM|nr:LysR family transcriptional regulator [Thermosinus carboxydivorans]EAX48998.1 transcriptional regulator, LysR family [Thermosinus carboxydivorans Nor1]
MLDLQLLVFKTVVEKNSISLAAQELHMTQSAVSQHIQNLETHFGVKLFDRLHRRIAITAAGEALYPYAVELETLYQRAQKAIQTLTDDVSGRLRIGASLTIGEYIMPKVLVMFRQLYPNVDMTMEIYNSEQITAMVIDGVLDVGFIEGPFQLSGNICAVPCGGDELAVIAPPSHPLACGEPCALGALLSQRWVMRERTSGTRRFFELFVEKAGYALDRLNVVMELGSTQAIKEAVKAGFGIAAISILAVSDEVERGEMRPIVLQEGPVRRDFTMIYNAEKFCTLAVEKFLAFVPQHFGQ